MSIGDWITYICLAIAVWYVPRYLIRVYLPGLGPWLRRQWEGAVAIQRARYEQRAPLYGLRDMSSEMPEPPAESGSRAGSGIAVLGQQNQENHELVPDLEGVIDYLSRQNMSPEQAAAILAVMRQENGEYFLSANKIRDAVGGSDTLIKSAVAARRPKAKAAPPAHSVRRPVNGW